MKWVRAKDGMIFGVCKGLARSLDIPLGVFRLIWLVSLLFLGAGLGLYLILAICLPREDKTAEAADGWIMGVCSKIARRTGLEVGIVRFLAICLSLLSFGATLVGYVVLYFVLDDRPEGHNGGRQSSESSPPIPPATT